MTSYNRRRSHLETLTGSGEANPFFEQVVEQMRGGMVVTNAAGVVLYINPAAHRIWGTGSPVAVGQRFPYPLLPEERQPLSLSVGNEMRVVEMLTTRGVCEGENCFLVHLRDVTEHVREEEHWRALSMVDELTGLYNRRGFTILAQQQIKLVNRLKGELCLLYADLDDLKMINDVLGHRTGDAALTDMANLLKETFRESDILARVGGDEFVMLGSGTSSEVDYALMQRLQERLAAFNATANRPYQLSLSIGVSRYPGNQADTLEDLLHHADTMMYQQKHEKKNGIARSTIPAKSVVPSLRRATAAARSTRPDTHGHL